MRVIKRKVENVWGARYLSKNTVLHTAPLLCQLTAVKIRDDFLHKILELTVTSLYFTFQEARGGVDGSGTAIQAGKARVQIPDGVSWIFL